MRAVCAFKGMWVLQECCELPHLGCKEPWASPEGGGGIPSITALSLRSRQSPRLGLLLGASWDSLHSALQGASSKERCLTVPSLLQVPEI